MSRHRSAGRWIARWIMVKVVLFSSIVLLAVLVWDVVTSIIDDGRLTWADVQSLLALFGDIGLVSYFLFRGLRGHRRPGVLPLVLALNGLVAATLASTCLVIETRVQLSNHHPLRLGLLLLVEPVWLLWLVQSAAGLQALGGSRTQHGELLIG